MNLYEYVKNSPVKFLDSTGFETDEGLDLVALWELIKAFTPKPDKSKCSYIFVGLNDVKLHDTWSVGFCPPFTDQIFGWSVTRKYLEGKIPSYFPIEKYPKCEFPCFCDLKKGWGLAGPHTVSISTHTFVTAYWGIGLSPPGFELSPDASHFWACDFYFITDISLLIDYDTGRCCSPGIWLDEPVGF